MRRWVFLGIVIALIGIGVLFRFSLMTFALYALALVYTVATLLARSSLDGVECVRGIPDDRAELGDSLHIRSMIENRKPFPLFWLLVEDMLPRNLPTKGDYVKLLTMPPRSKRVLEYSVRFTRRGYHQIGPVVLESGDLFGFVRRIRTARMAHYVTVRPVPVPILRYDIATYRPIGEIRVRRQIYEDPTRMAGVREYRVGDPLNRIHWKTTARTGELHCRIYEPTVLAGSMIILDFHGSAYERAHATAPGAASVRSASAHQPATARGYTDPFGEATYNYADDMLPAVDEPMPNAEELFNEADEDDPAAEPPPPELLAPDDEPLMAPQPGAGAASDEDRAELACIAAASLASYVLELKETVGLMSNGVDAAERVKRESGSDEAVSRKEARERAFEREKSDRLRPVLVTPGRGAEKSGEILDALARLELSEGLTLRQMLVEEIQRLPTDLALIVITPRLGQSLMQSVARLKYWGHSITVVLIDNPEHYRTGRAYLEAQHVRVLHIRKPADLHDIAMSGL